MEHMPHWMHREGSTRTAPVGASRPMARGMQAAMHGAGSQWRHLLGKAKVAGPGPTWMRGGVRGSSKTAP